MNREKQLDKELRFHMEQQVEDYIAAGMTRAAAERKVRLEFGGIEQVKEECRESRSLAFVNALWRDLLYGSRMLRRNPGFTAVAVLSIALGIGANTAIFSVIYALLLRWLPVPNPQQLAQVMIVIQGKPQSSFSYPVVQALAARKDIFSNLGSHTGGSIVVGPPDAPVRTPGGFVSGEFYPAMELQPVMGRLLGPEDDRPGAPLVAVITDGYWERIFHRDPRAIGRVLLVENHPVQIIGVTPPGFTGANVGEINDVVMTFQTGAQLYPDRASTLQAGNQYMRIIARPAAGTSMEQARARLKVIWPGMAGVSVSPKTPAKRREAMLASSLDLVPGGTGWTPLRNQYEKPLYILMSISALVLLVACANVANLLLAWSTARRREIAIRLAIGASRGRVVRQLLVESLLLASIGAALGLALAQAGSQALVGLVSANAHLGVGLNPQVLGFTIVVAVLTGLIFGLAPAFRATASGRFQSICPALKSSERTSEGSRGLLGPSLVSAQVALSLLLLIGAGLFVRTMRNLQSVDPGFRHQGVLMLDADARRVLKTDQRIAAFYRENLEAIAQIRGVKAVGVSNYTPVSGGFWSQSVTINGQPTTEEEHPFFAVSPGFFETLHISLQAGRDFTARDDASAPPVVIVNEEFVRRLIPGGHPLGQRVSVADANTYQNMEIVGVAANSLTYTLRQSVRPTVYVPFFQQPADRLGYGTFEIQVDGSLTAVSTAAIQRLRPSLPGIPLTTRSFTSQVEDSFRREILMAKLAGFFGVLALVLAAIGLYGLLAYMVTRRTGEIGIRMALGAQRRQVLWMVLGGALRLVAIGVALGLPAAWWASRLVSGMLYGLTATDPLTIAASVALLAAAAVAAGFIPAQRASRVEPMAALRYE